MGTDALYACGRLYLTENKHDSSAIAFELLKERFPNDPVTACAETALGESTISKQNIPKQ